MNEPVGPLPVPASTFAGKTVLLLGRSGPLSAKIVSAFASSGAKIAATGEGLDHIVCQMLLPATPADPAAVAALFDVIEVTLGPVDLLIVERATTGREAAEHVSWDRWRQVFSTSVDLAALAAAELARRCFARDGAGDILVLTANHVSGGAAGCSVHGAAASALASLVKSWTAEWLLDNVRANLIEVGPYADSGEAAFALARERNIDVAQSIPVGRVGTAREIAALALFIASPYAAYIAGAQIRIDGGEWLRANLGGQPYTAPRIWAQTTML